MRTGVPRYATEGSNPGLVDRVPGRPATHTCEPCLGKPVLSSATTSSAARGRARRRSPKPNLNPDPHPHPHPHPHPSPFGGPHEWALHPRGSHSRPALPQVDTLFDVGVVLGNHQVGSSRPDLVRVRVGVRLELGCRLGLGLAHRNHILTRWERAARSGRCRTATRYPPAM